MGKVYSHIAFRISRNLNVENRAHKLISQEKIRPPPKLKSTEEYLEKLRSEQPAISEELTKKDNELLKRLEDVYVTSKDPTVSREASAGGGGDGHRSSALPSDRTPATLSRFGYTEPARVPYGRVTLRAAVGLLTEHTEAPQTHTAEAIARQHKLDSKTVEAILAHFHLMRLHMPETDTGMFRPMDWISQEPVSELHPWEIPQLQEAAQKAADKEWAAAAAEAQKAGADGGGVLPEPSRSTPDEQKPKTPS